VVKSDIVSLYKFGRHEIRSKIKRGGMAAVFHAYDPRFQRHVALKVLPPEFNYDPSFRARFEREAQTIAALEHPAIVPVYDFGEEGNLPYLVMRYLPGGSLADRLQETGALDLSETTRIINHLAPALDKVHCEGIVHRDLKPSNILFDQLGNSFITDFGIVKFADSDQTLTSTGAVVGTPSYMSPEQARGTAQVDSRSDIYAFGVILFQMLTGRLPFQADTPMGVALKHVVDPVPNIIEFKPDLPTGCQTVIFRAMAKEPEQRYPTISALAAALIELESSSSHPNLAPVTAQPVERPEDSTRLADRDEPPPKPSGVEESDRDRAFRLLHELDDPVKLIFARSSLVAMGNEAVKPLTETLLSGERTSVRSNSAAIIQLICEEYEVKSLTRARAIRALIKALADPEVAVRYCSAKALSTFKGKNVEMAVTPLGTLLDDPDEYVREQARATLKSIGGKHARKTLSKHKKHKGWF
jgi:serine/threonine-protein kinase